MTDVLRLHRPLALFAGIFAVFAAVSPLDFGIDGLVQGDHLWSRMIFGILGITALRESQTHTTPANAVWNMPFATLLAAFEILGLAHGEGPRGWGFFCGIAAVWLAAWRTVDIVITQTPVRGRKADLLRLLVPLIFGATLLTIWETLAVALDVPKVILPTPSAILFKLATSVPVLAADFVQTAQGVLAGYFIGCGSAVLVAIAIDRIPFLERGLLPLGNLVSALPIVGIAPIMVMWFGFDWQSKAAVVVIMTFFPMLVNTVAGLSAAGHMERDLMKTYAASYRQTLLALRLPSALPFIFNGLKINSTLAFIGAIVAEFFGTPIVGMGFRINTEVGRMNIDMVWATIVVAGVAGSLFYGLLALIERRVTFWHASYRQGVM
jgi:NitT/TauT family transport system permease protein